MINCPEPDCDESFADRHRLVDHLSDDHRAFDWVVDGRPVAMGGE